MVFDLLNGYNLYKGYQLVLLKWNVILCLTENLICQFFSFHQQLKRYKVVVSHLFLDIDVETRIGHSLLQRVYNLRLLSVLKPERHQ